MAIRLHSLPTRHQIAVRPLGATTLLACLGMAVLASGCPNPEDRYNEFLEATKDQRMDAGGDGDGDTGNETPGDGDGDTGETVIFEMLDGTYLFALETSLGPDLPLQFVTTISNTVVAEDGSGATADFSFQPLSLNQNDILNPRECLDEMLTFEDVVFDAEGNFEIDMGLIMVSGAANPVTGSDIEATILVMGHVVHEDAMCGEFDGDLISPLESPLTGSTFAAIRLDDNGCTPETLPITFPYKCAMVPPPDAPEYSGYYLFALETSLGPDLPLQFVTTVEYTALAEGGGMVNLSFQPLSLNQNDILNPREFIGEPLTFEDIPVTAEGTFDVDMGLVMVPGAANPVTGSDIEATILVHAELRDENTMCGEFEGMLISPLESPLDGSTFAATRLMDDGSDPMTLPTMFPYKCSQL